MKKELYKSLDLNDFQLSYYIVENSSNSSFGIEISKTVDGIIKESETLYNIYNSKDKVNNLLEKISEGSVTPTSLDEIMDNLLE